MNEFEAAFFYGDFSVLRETITKFLYENPQAVPVPAEIST